MIYSNRAVTAAGERFRDYKELPTDRKVIQEFRQFRCETVTDLFRTVASALTGKAAVLSCRIKRVNTIVRKLRREHKMDLVRMDDVIGFRIIAASAKVQQEIVEKLLAELPRARIKDYVAKPAPSGYRAVHLIFDQNLTAGEPALARRYPCEVQIRTYFQHLWATMSESFGEQVKEGGGTEEERAYLLELSQRIREAEESRTDSEQIVDLKTSLNTRFIVVHYDKRNRENLHIERFGPDLTAAAKQTLYLEELHRQDFQRETVLLGAAEGEVDLKVTHLRYYEPLGIPALPEIIRPAKSRPGL